MFAGLSTPKLDEKGRLFLPARFRDQLTEGVTVTKGQERCLYVFTTPYFERKAAELQGDSSKAARDYGRLLFSSAYNEVPDRQGRITVNPLLRAYAGLEKDCVVVGVNTRIEIWNAASWGAYESQQTDTFSAGTDEGIAFIS